MSVADYWSHIQSSLFPHLSQCLEEPLTPKLMQLCSILEVARVEEQPFFRDWQHMGRKRCDRRAIARAFIAKAVYDIPTTEMLIERLRMDQSFRRICGWERRNQVPSRATFSRAFAELSGYDLGEKVHVMLVSTHIGERIVGHICRDSTEIQAREKPAEKPVAPARIRYRRGRPKKGEQRPFRRGERLKKQMVQTPEEALAELPTSCGVGTKSDSKGHPHYWVGYKAHIDTADGGLPVTVITTSASLHDSQAAIPMAKRTAGRVTALYELMDSAYDADLVHETCIGLGHKPIIQPHGRRKDSVPFDPATELRYKERTVSERVNSRLKDEFGCRHVRVRGHAKVHLHIMFGVIALFADQALKLLRT